MSGHKITVVVELDRRDIRDAHELTTHMQGEADERRSEARRRIMDAVHGAAIEAERKAA